MTCGILIISYIYYPTNCRSPIMPYNSNPTSLKLGHKTILILISVFAFYTCIDPYDPILNRYESLLVVEGVITDQDISNTIKLSRTFQDKDNNPVMVSDAIVNISDDKAIITSFKNVGKGIYKTDSLQFRGVPGRFYTLHIITSNGDEYKSESCVMTPVPDIDKIYFEKNEEFVSNGTEKDEGIMIFLDSKDGEQGSYCRWDYEETWEFKVPYPRKYAYLGDEVVTPVPIKDYCWKKSKSNEIIINSLSSGPSGKIIKQPVLFIATDKSDRLSIQYSILIKQYSVSKNEYDFWSNLKMVNENVGDLFATQPYPVISNIHNISNSKEKVLGYFQVSAIKEKRFFIKARDLAGLNLPFFVYPCERIEASPKENPWNQFKPPLTFDEIYKALTTSGYYFVEPKYSQTGFLLDAMVFTKPECADCEITGTVTKPEFWID